MASCPQNCLQNWKYNGGRSVNMLQNDITLPLFIVPKMRNMCFVGKLVADVF